ncbi:hypothetical protein CDG77_28515 [Nostoc sp. 'Peltigera membranacea cyanobiont' 213]|nr:hypothetical protein CDG77_28515 [Nostoc sp. 'Peltigera membranacea cyanobiont' 213]
MTKAGYATSFMVEHLFCENAIAKQVFSIKPANPNLIPIQNSKLRIKTGQAFGAVYMSHSFFKLV